MPRAPVERALHRSTRLGVRVLALVLGLALAGPAAALPLDDRFQRELPPRSKSPLDPLDLGDPQPGGEGTGKGEGGMGEGGGRIELRGGGGGRGRREAGGDGIRLRGGDGEPLDGPVVFHPERFDPEAPPREGDTEWQAGQKRVFEDGEWSGWVPPSEGDLERDGYRWRRFEDGEWTAWREPRDGDTEWQDGYKREFADGQWGEWQPPETGDIEPRGDQEREFLGEDEGWGEWQERPPESPLARERERSMPHDVDSDDLHDDELPFDTAKSPPACSCDGVSVGGGLGGVGQAILWVLLGIAAVVVIVLVTRAILARRKKSAGASDDVLDDDDDDVLDDDDDASDDDAPAAEDGLVAALRRGPLESYEQLAAEGRFAEAIHALLLHVLGALVRAAGVRLRDSLTSRELIAALGLEADARAALARLVQAAELCHFGLRPADRALYERCLGDGHTLLAGGAAPPVAPSSASAAL